MSLFSKEESYLGVDLGAGGIKLVELKKTKNRPQLWTYGILDESIDVHPETLHDKSPEELLEKSKNSEKDGKEKVASSQMVNKDDPRIDKYARMLRILATRAQVSTKRVTASLPVSQIFHAVVTLPFVPEKELAHHVNAKITKMLPRPIEEMQVVHHVISSRSDEKESALKILVTAASLDLVAFYTAIFQKAGLTLEALETEAFALERSLVGLDSATAMIVDIGAARTNFFIIDSQLPITHRSLQIGGDDFDELLGDILDVPKEDMSQIKEDIGRLNALDVPQDLFRGVIDPIAKEIEYGFDLFLHQTGNEGKRPEKIILTGGVALFPAVASYLREMFQMKVFVGDPWARVVYQDQLKSTLDAIGPRMAVCIGLAMRNIV